MAKKHEKVLTSAISRVIIGLTIVAGIGAVIGATPVSVAAISKTPVSQAYVVPATAMAASSKSLGDGPSIVLSRTYGRDDEDCVSVRKIVSDGPASRVTMVCAR